MTTEAAAVRVLMVDSQPECEDIVSVLLRRWGHQVRTVTGGLFPMDDAREFAPELVMIHVGRPEFRNRLLVAGLSLVSKGQPAATANASR